MHNIARDWSDLGSDRGGASQTILGFSLPASLQLTGKFSALDNLLERVSYCPWPATTGSMAPHHAAAHPSPRPLYTPEERLRRDSSPWTLVQGVLAPVQFLVFLISVGLVLRYLSSGEGYGFATASIVVKTLVLYTIMVTGAIWEKRVFGRYLFAPSFYWEDVFSMLVLALHTAYLVALLADLGTADGRMRLALAAYATYAINATQFVLKLRAARLQASRPALDQRAAGQGR